MTVCLTLRMRASDIERVSEKIWEVWGETEGIQEAPDTGSGLFAIREDFEILEFGSEAAKKAARWLETDAYRGKGRMRLNVYLGDAATEESLKRRVPELASLMGCELEWVSLESMAEKDYLEEYRKSVRDTALGKNLWVGPPWDLDPEAEGRERYFVEPGLAFGTGDHPTTQLMLIRIEELGEELGEERGQQLGGSGTRFERVLDLGCGTGVLGLAARRRLAPAKLYLADLDPLCEHEVRKTFALNHESLDDGRSQGHYGNGGTAQAINKLGLRFDLIISNIYAEVLAAIAPDIKKILKPGGLWMCSGILEGKSETILEQATERLFDCRERRSPLKKGATLDSQKGMQVLDETWVLREYVHKD